MSAVIASAILGVVLMLVGAQFVERDGGRQANLLGLALMALGFACVFPLLLALRRASCSFWGA